MISKEKYLSSITNELKKSFGKRLLYVGLQGSYLRNEATENSDIDIMTVIDGLTAADLNKYRAVIKIIGDTEKACGFICGRRDLEIWNPLESCHVKNTTQDVYGNISDFLPKYSNRDTALYIKVSVNNLYHATCHRFIYTDRDNSQRKLPLEKKEIFYILQNICQLEKNIFPQTKKELEKIIMEPYQQDWRR